MDAHAIAWSTGNHDALAASLDEIRNLLKRAGGAGTGDRVERDADAPAEMGTSLPAALLVLRDRFSLTRFECDVLLLCAGMELESDFAALCATANGDGRRGFPTFGLALRVLRDAHWDAISPVAPLRRWCLLRLDAHESVTECRLGLDERILHYLLGLSYIDERLHKRLQPIVSGAELPPSHQRMCAQIVERIQRSSSLNESPIVQLCGRDGVGKKEIAAGVCDALGSPLYGAHLEDLPGEPQSKDLFARLWQREVLLSGCSLLVEGFDHDETVLRAPLRLVTALAGQLIVSSREAPRLEGRSVFRVEVAKPTADEQKAIWHQHLGKHKKKLNGQIDDIVSHFDLCGRHIRAMTMAVDGARSRNGRDLGDELWGACRAQTRSHLDDLVQPIIPTATWDDLVLPDAQKETLGAIALHLRQRAKVYREWGFGDKFTRGLGISALFSGDSGTGKTMAAEVLGNTLHLDVYRIDLSTVVSKYIGETEKNLRRVFDAAETSGAILLFDEADALFGKRSEVRDSHDRYANVEVAYLLQRMESYRGLAILTTNMKDALDRAFLRRIRFVVHFPFPNEVQRQEIWEKVFPSKTRVKGLKPAQLAQLNVTGGSIRNIALNAAFVAADEGAPVQMRHVMRAASAEYTKLERPLTEAETGGWA